MPPGGESLNIAVATQAGVACWLGIRFHAPPCAAGMGWTQHREGTAAMARIPLALAAVTLAATLGSHLAVAQSNPAYQTPTAISPTGQPMQPPVAPEMNRSGGMQHQRPMPRRAPGQSSDMTTPAAPMGSGMSSGSGMGSGMGAGSGMASTTMTPNGPMVQTPTQPFSGLDLPKQGVGDGAYNGGGVVLEYMPDGTRRVVQQ
jgi:hypothetical protein